MNRKRPSADAAEAVARFGVDEDLDVDDLDASEREEMEEALVDEASAAATRSELEAEVATLSRLVTSQRLLRWVTDSLSPTSSVLQLEARLHGSASAVPVPRGRSAAQ